MPRLHSIIRPSWKHKGRSLHLRGSQSKHVVASRTLWVLKPQNSLQETLSVVSVLCKHHSIMESILVQLLNRPTKQFNRETLSLKKLCCEVIVSIFHVLCPHPQLQCQMPGNHFPSMKIQNTKPVIILSFTINCNSISHDELLWHYGAFRCTPKGLRL